MQNEIAEIYINQLNSKLDCPFDYVIPEELKNSISIGKRVIIPFSRKNNLIDGIVTKIKGSSDYKNLKEIKYIIEDYPELSEKQIEMCFWIKKKYHCLLMEAINCYIPSNMKIKNSKDEYGNKKYYISNSRAYKYIIKLSGKYKVKDQYIQEIKKNAKNQIAIINALEYGEMELDKLRNIIKFDNNSLKRLIEKKLVIKDKQRIFRSPLKDNNYFNPEKKLNNQQKLAINEFESNFYKDAFTYLLYGITGSGKTEVYLNMMELTIKCGKKCIYLVPEISLTSHVIETIVGRFKEKVAILHSKLSDGEKIDQWASIKNNDINIVVGTRSAIFSPLEDLGLIVLDEEHENTYKSSNRPRYHTIDIANKLKELYGCNIVLGSATPSIKSYHKVLNGDYKLLKLPSRINKNSLPKVEIVDMRQELYEGNRSMLSKKLIKEIKDRLIKKEQIILFLNKRGYSSYVFCRDCGYVIKCHKCDVSMTYHSTSKKVVCHYCGYSMNNPQVCPSCNSKRIKYTGSGTQKLEDILIDLYPNINIVRMDTDSMQRKGAYEKAINKFKNGEADILLGTQMVAKGFDFHNVTLVGVILADSILNIPDFKSPERAFQLITQVAGRAGRGNKEGNVIVQTYDPEHYSIKLSKNHNYNDFYDKEISFRKRMGYPPFSEMIYIGFVNESEEKVIKDCKTYYNMIIYHIRKNNLHKLISDIYLPSPSPVNKINNKYRWHILIKTTQLDSFNKIINHINNDDIIINMKSNIIIDINPNSIL